MLKSARPFVPLLFAYVLVGACGGDSKPPPEESAFPFAEDFFPGHPPPGPDPRFRSSRISDSQIEALVKLWIASEILDRQGERAVSMATSGGASAVAEARTRWAEQRARLFAGAGITEDQFAEFRRSAAADPELEKRLAARLERIRDRLRDDPVGGRAELGMPAPRSERR